MKKILLFVVTVFISLIAIAQTPESFQYQAVVRDGNGDVLSDQIVKFQISIISGSALGTVEFVETHSITTNVFGLVTMSVGSGTVVTGDFSAINWGNSNHFIKVEVDIAGGSNYTDMGTVQLLSVPYALYAKNSGNQFSGSYDDLSNKPVLAGDVTGQIEANTVTAIQGMGISANIPANGQVLKWNHSLQIWEPSDDQLGAAGTTDGVVTGASFAGSNTKTLTLIRSNGLGDITAVFTDMVDDADADPTNELQTLSISGAQLSISDGNSVTLPVTTYTAGSGIDIQGGQIINLAPDQNVTIDNGTGISVTGTYPTFTIANTHPDQPVTITGSGAATVTGAYPNFIISSTDQNTEYSAGTGIDIQGNQIINANPDQLVTLTGIGATSVSGTYPNYTISSTDNNTVYTAGSGIDIQGVNIINTSPDQTVVLTGTGATSVSGTYPNFTINSVDNNTTYSAGTGLTLSGTTFHASAANPMWNASQLQTVAVSATAPASGQVLKYNGTNWAPAADQNTTYSAGTGLNLSGTTFSHPSHTGDVTGAAALTVTGIQGRQVTSNAPANGQVLKWNSTNSRWELGDDELGAAGTNDGVVTSIGVTGTTTKTITLTRSQSLPDLTATFTDDGSVYTAGSGISIASNVITNTTPDQTVTLTQGGATTITGTYPNFTISSANTTYTAGTGMTLSGTTFNAQTANALWNANQIQNVGVATTTPSSGQVLKYNGTNWAPAADATGTGTVTSIATNNGITGGTITTTGTLGLTGQALALHNLAVNGFITRTAAGVVAARTITGASGITVTNGDGISGNPTLTPTYGTTAGTIAQGNHIHATLTRGTGLTGGNYDGSTAATWAVNFGTTAGTVAEGSHAHGSYGVAGTNGMVQFNNSGVFGGVQSLFWDNANNRLMVNGLTTSGQQSNLIVRQLLNPVNATRDSVILANLGLDIRQNSTTSYWGAGMKFTVGNADTYTGTAAIFAERTGGWSSGDLHFALNDVGISGKTALPIRMTIKNTGRVGIGTRTPTAQLEVRSNYNSPSAEALFEVKNKAGQTVFVVYEDSVRIFIDDDGTKTNKGTFAVSGRNTAKAMTNNFLWVTPDSSRVYTGDANKGFGVRSISGTTISSYMNLTPYNYFIGHNSGTKALVDLLNENGVYNSTLGYEAGKELNYGSSNVYLGYKAGRDQTSGRKNVIVGSEAGLNTNTTYSVMIGTNVAKFANGDDNVYIGYNTGYLSAARDNFTCVMVGSGAGYNAFGAANTFIGNNSGSVYSTTPVERNDNIFIGDAAGYKSTSWGLGSGNICIGNYAGAASGSTGNNQLFIENSGDVTNPLIHGNFTNNKIAFHRQAGTLYALQVGTSTANGNGAYLTVGGTWTNASSKSFKDRFKDIDGNDLLNKISQMEIKGWYYKETEEYHIGPFAEDFYNAFGCGDLSATEDLGRYISSGDVAGVSIIAVKALNQKVETLSSENEKQQIVIQQLLKRIEELEQRAK